MVPRWNSKTTWFDFLSFYLEFDFTGIRTIIFDFNRISFLQTYQIVILGCLIEHLVQRFGIIPQFIGGSDGLNGHLNNIKFKSYWNPGFNRDKYTEAHNSTTLCLWHISKPMIEAYGMQVQDYFRRSHFIGMDLQPLASSLVEVFNNIFDHSASPIQGYVLTQHFPKINELSFVVSDLGVGIPNSINLYKSKIGEIPLPDHLAISKSLERGVTSKSSPQNAGFGLANVLEFIEDSNGSIEIYSGNGYFYKKAGNTPVNHYLSNFNANGTLIEVKIDTRTIEPLDEESQIYDF